jgi:hypothetical protein
MGLLLFTLQHPVLARLGRADRSVGDAVLWNPGLRLFQRLPQVHGPDEPTIDFHLPLRCRQSLGKWTARPVLIARRLFLISLGSQTA